MKKEGTKQTNNFSKKKIKILLFPFAPDPSENSCQTTSLQSPRSFSHFLFSVCNVLRVFRNSRTRPFISLVRRTTSSLRAVLGLLGLGFFLSETVMRGCIGGDDGGFRDTGTTFSSGQIGGCDKVQGCCCCCCCCCCCDMAMIH